MHITHTHTLSPIEKEALLYLTEHCRLSDNLTLSFPQDANDYWLLNDDHGTVKAYFAACKIDEGLWECYAFTHPDCRSRGYFSQLLEQACDYGQEHGDPVLAFVSDERCPQALEILEHLEAKYSHSEYIMYIPLSSFGEATTPTDMVLEFDTVTDHCQEGEAGTQERQITVSAYNQSELSVVTCRLMIRDRKAYLFSLETLPKYRRQGLARRFLIQLIADLGNAAYDILYLHVSSTNEGAMNLYKKTGFQIKETLSYYLY